MKHEGIALRGYRRRPASLAAAIPGATIEIMEGCGHVMLHERPAEFNQRAIRFLDGADDGARSRITTLPSDERESVG
jgi:hypothetical protein